MIFEPLFIVFLLTQILSTKFPSVFQFDFDKNGHITSKEIGETMKSLGEDIPGYRLRDIIAEVDTNKNGTVEFDEFLQVSLSLTSCMFLALRFFVIF